MYRRLASLSAPRGWIQSSWASVNRSESQIIATATDSRARGINIKRGRALSLVRRGESAHLFRFGTLAIQLPMGCRSLVAGRSMEQTGHSYP